MIVRHESAFKRQELSLEYALCCIRDEGRPLGAAIQVEAPNHRKLLWSKAMVVSVTEKAKLDFVRCVPMETNNSEPLITCRKRRDVIKTGR